MYIAYAFILAVAYFVFKGIINLRDKRFKVVEELTEETVGSFNNKKFNIRWNFALLEVVVIMTVVMLLWMGAFNSGFSEGREIIFVVIGMFMFIVAYLRLLYVISISVYYDDEYLYINKPFSKKKVKISGIRNVTRLSYHISFISEEHFFLTYIPLNITHIHYIYRKIK